MENDSTQKIIENTETNTVPKISNFAPEVSKKRLDNLQPSGVGELLLGMTVLDLVTAAIREIDNRCIEFEMKLNNGLCSEFELYWTRIVRSKLLKFKNGQYQNLTSFTQNLTFSAPANVTTCFNDLSVKQIFQTIIDVVQHKEIQLKSLTDSFGGIQMELKKMEKEHMMLINLYKKCTGTWKPTKSTKNKISKDEPEKKQINIEHRPQRDMVNHQRKPFQRRQQDFLDDSHGSSGKSLQFPSEPRTISVNKDELKSAFDKKSFQRSSEPISTNLSNEEVETLLQKVPDFVPKKKQESNLPTNRNRTNPPLNQHQRKQSSPIKIPTDSDTFPPIQNSVKRSRPVNRQDLN
jgi:hypothetical protein